MELNIKSKLLVESLKRLYDGKQITEAKILELYKNGKIKETDKIYILGKE